MTQTSNTPQKLRRRTAPAGRMAWRKPTLRLVHRIVQTEVGTLYQASSPEQGYPASKYTPHSV